MKLKIISTLLFVPFAFAQGLINNTSTNLTNQVQNVTIFTGTPVLDIFLISIAVTLISSLITKKMTPQEDIKTLKKDLKELQKQMRGHIKAKEQDKIQKIQREIMQINQELFKKNMNLKQMVLTLVPFMLLFAFLKANYSPLGEFLNLGFTTFGWFGTYFWFSVISSIIWRKILKLA